MNKRKFIQKIMTVFLISTINFSVFSQEVDIAAVYEKVDMAFATRSTENIDKMLKEFVGKREYAYAEAYTLKKTRMLIIENNLTLARQTALIVIDNNIENFDAVDLYSYIDRAILNQQAAMQAAENRKRLEAERIAAANSKAKQQIENRGNFQNVSTASGKTVYMNEQASSFSSVLWTVKVGIADVMYQMISEPSYNSLKYGIALGGNFFYPSERFIFGFDAFADALILTIGDSEQEFIFSGKFVPEIAFSDFSKNVFLRFGFSSSILASNNRDLSNSAETFATPVVGFALDNINIGESKLSIFADYDFGHLAYDAIDAAAEFGGSILLPMSVNEKTKIGLDLGVQNLLLKTKDGFENRPKFTFAIGVGNVSK